MKRLNMDQTGSLNAEPQSSAEFRRGILPTAFRVLCVSALILWPGISTFAATNDLTTLLQRGLFEEEANRNLDAAIASYDALAKQFDKNRQIAATAIFRLGECYRKLGRTNDAVQHYERILREFSDQQTLATLSRQNLSAITPVVVSTLEPAQPGREAYEYVIKAGETLSTIVTSFRNKGIDVTLDSVLRMNPGLDANRMRVGQKILIPTGADSKTGRGTQGSGTSVSSAIESADAEAAELAAIISKLRAQSPENLRTIVLQNYRTPVLTKLLENLTDAEQKFVSLQPTYGPDHPLYKNAQDLIKTINKQIDEQVLAVLTGFQDKRDIAVEKAKLLRSQSVTAGSASPSQEANLDDEEKEIRRIQAMIQNSPDLINAPTGDPSLTPLARAASQGYMRVAEFLLKNGAEIDQTSGSISRTPLHHAVYNGHRNMAELLINRGADVNARPSAGVTPLYIAVERRFQSLVELLLSSKADPNLAASQSTSRLNDTPLMVAVRNGAEPIVSLLLTHGADPNRANRTGQGRSSRRDSRGDYGSALHMASARAFPRITALLLTNGANVKLLNVDGETPLHVAAAKGATNNVLQIIRAGADVNATGLERETGGATPLFLAVSEGHVETVRLLLQNGANPNVAVLWGNAGVTPLMIAVGIQETTSLLLKAGALPNVEDSGGLTALSRAVEVKSPEVVRTLVAHGANPDTRRGGWPVLTLAVTDYADTGVVAELIRAKADVNAHDPDGCTPLHRAVMMKRKDFVAQLLTAGADPNLRNKEGQTPLELLGATQPYASAGVIPMQLRPGPATLSSGSLQFNQTQSSDSQTPPTADLATLLRQHGALDEVPDFSVIKVKWLGQERGVIAWRAHTNGWNRFTLIETLSLRQPGSDFPDYSRVLVHRPAGNGRSKAMEITANLLNATNGIDCSKDIWLEFGDIVEIPERDHPLAEKAREVRDQQVGLMLHCTLRQVQLTVRGQTRELKLWNFPLSRALSEPGAKSLLLSSSDLSRVKVTRKIPGKQQPVEMIVNVAANPPFEQDLWLRDGDVIEVPEK